MSEIGLGGLPIKIRGKIGVFLNLMIKLNDLDRPIQKVPKRAMSPIGDILVTESKCRENVAK